MIAENIIIGWPGAVSTIPSGWSRVTELDSKYIRFIPDDTTDPGDTGGAASHAHTTPGHTHGLDHTHSAATSGAASSVFENIEDGSVVRFFPAAGHTHSTSLATTSGQISGSASPGTDSVLNQLARLEVIWLKSDGTSERFPEGAILFAQEPVNGFVLYGIGEVFIRGAAAAVDGGSEESGSLAAHTHEVDAHTHTGVTHSHPTSASSGASALHSGYQGNATDSVQSHGHNVTSASTSTGGLSSGSGGVTGSESPQPPFVKLKFVSSQDALPETGIICLWIESLESIPEDWFLCNGAEETPDLCTGLFIKNSTAEDVLETGGAETHTHAAPSNHVHGIGSHSHSLTYADVARMQPTGDGGGFNITPHIHASGHNHSSASASGFVASASVGSIEAASHIPEYIEVAPIMYQRNDLYVNVSSGELNFGAPGGSGAPIEMEVWIVRLEPHPNGEAELYDSK